LATILAAARRDDLRRAKGNGGREPEAIVIDLGATNAGGTLLARLKVAGVAALYLSKFGNQSAATVRNALIANATTGVISNVGTGSPNRLLFENY